MFFGSKFLTGTNNELSMRFKTSAQLENAKLMIEMFNYFSNIAVTRYDWKNLPDGVDERLLNFGLYMYGNVAFFEHENLGLTALPCNRGNTFNILYEPLSVTAFGYAYSTELNIADKEFGFVRSSPTAEPLAYSVFEYVKRMCDILRSIDVISQRMKRPYIIMCDEKQRLTIDNLFKKIKDNEELILGLKDYPIDKQNIEIAPTPSPTNLDKLWDSYNQYSNLLLTRLGLNSVDRSKRERLIVDEANANNMIIQMENEVNLKQLTIDIDKVNKIFGTNISVEVKELSSFNIKPWFDNEVSDSE